MSTPAELYPAILTDPDNLELRLRYADAVQASDPEHAELIRLDVEREQLGREGQELPVAKSQRRRRLARAIGPRIAAQVAPLVDAWQLRRGFPEVVKMSAARFLAAGPEVYAKAPVRHLILTDAASQLDALLTSPLLDRLTSLDLTGNELGDDGVRALAASPHLRNLRFLGLSRTGAGLPALEALAATGALPDLRHVSFIGNRAELNPHPVAQDPISGDVVEIEFPGTNQKLIEKYGARPWLTYAGPHADVGLAHWPDYGDV